MIRSRTATAIAAKERKERKRGRWCNRITRRTCSSNGLTAPIGRRFSLTFHSAREILIGLMHLIAGPGKPALKLAQYWRPTRRCGEREPADSRRQTSIVIGGGLPSLTSRSLQPTQDGAGSSAVAGGALTTRVARLCRSTN